MKKVIPLLLVICLAVGIFSGCSLLSAKSGADKTFTSDEGLTITLTDNFSKSQIEGYTLCYDSFDAAVFALKESFSDYPELDMQNMALDEYKGYVIEANSKFSPKEDTSFDGLTVLKYEYYVEEQKSNFTYFISLFKGSDAFWLVQFACKSSNYGEFEPYFVKWAKSVKV